MKSLGVAMVVLYLWATFDGVFAKEVVSASDFQYVVQVQGKASSVFSPEVREWTGTGVIYSVSETEVIIFTNRHVVETTPLEASEFSIEFVGNHHQRKTVTGEVVFKSHLYDFAVLKVKLSDLGEEARNIRPAPIGSFYQVDKGSKVRAVGFYDSSLHFLEGEITGMKTRVFHSSSYLQTNLDLQHGYSGGPLIDLQSLQMIALNTAKDNRFFDTTYSIPIDFAVTEWKRFLEDPQYSIKNYLYAIIEQKEKAGYLEGVISSEVKRTIEEYISKNSQIFLIQEVMSGSPLQKGDVLLEIDQIPFGNDLEVLQVAIQRAKNGVIHFKVLREGRLQSVDVPIINFGEANLKRQREFLVINGIVFQDMMPDESAELAHGEDGIIVTDHSADTSATVSTQLPKASIILGVDTGDGMKSLKNLAALKEMLLNFKGEEKTVTFLIRSSWVWPGRGFTFSFPQKKTVTLKVSEVYSDQDIPMNLLKANFTWKKSWSWKEALKAGLKSCSSVLFKLGKK